MTAESAGRAGDRFADAIANATCPRCGHPQRGLLHSDAPAWPLRSACAECGLPIDWGDYVRTQFDLPRWWVEHATRRRLPVALVLTWCASLVGWPLWSRLRMGHPQRPRRLVVAIVALIAVTALVPVVEQVRAGAEALQWGLRFGVGVRPGTFVVWTQSGSVAYGGIVEEPSLLDWLKALAPAANPFYNGPLTLNCSVVLDIDGGQLPMDGRSFAQLNEPTDANRPPNLPSAIPRRWTVPLATASAWSVDPGRAWYGWWVRARYAIAFSVLACAASLGTFAVLPIARRRAKVRWAHVWRAGAYFAFGPGTLLLAAGTAIGATPLHSPSRFQVAGNAPSLLVIAAALLAVWWRLAAGTYLRMERPWAVSLSIAALSTLIACTATLTEF